MNYRRRNRKMPLTEKFLLAFNWMAGLSILAMMATYTVVSIAASL